MVSKTPVRIEKQSEVSETAGPTINPRLDIPHEFQDTRVFFLFLVRKSRKKAKNGFPKPDSE